MPIFDWHVLKPFPRWGNSRSESGTNVPEFFPLEKISHASRENFFAMQRNAIAHLGVQ
jgi:hypothetical protein